jgi:hypothetical protein
MSAIVSTSHNKRIAWAFTTPGIASPYSFYLSASIDFIIMAATKASTGLDYSTYIAEFQTWIHSGSNQCKCTIKVSN